MLFFPHKTKDIIQKCRSVEYRFELTQHFYEDLVSESKKEGVPEGETLSLYEKRKVNNKLKGKEERRLWKKYRQKVWNITNKQPLHKLENYNKRGFKDYHIDHQISIWYGFKNGIHEESIGHISNLKMIPEKENRMKGVTSVKNGTILIDFSKKSNK